MIGNNSYACIFISNIRNVIHNEHHQNNTERDAARFCFYNLANFHEISICKNCLITRDF